jgi:hypothetical protein
VGHIDYAIRRRFSFVYILPGKAQLLPHAEKLFEAVSGLFISNYAELDWGNPLLKRSDHLSLDFRPQDVWLGHSYFMTTEKDEEKAKAELKLKLKYEIMPILDEYVKDGVLLDSANQIINALAI